VLAELERAHPGFVDAWTPLARRVHAIDEGGACLALDVEGPLEDGVVLEARELGLPPEGASSPIRVDRAELRGTRVRLLDAQLVLEGGRLATLFADHRA
jgi:hypothetical protein